jgi:hypothetical protein
MAHPSLTYRLKFSVQKEMLRRSVKKKTADQRLRCSRGGDPTAQNG